MNQIKGKWPQLAWLAVWLCISMSAYAQPSVGHGSGGSAPTWISQNETSDTGDIVLEWLPVSGADYYQIEQSFTPPTQFGQASQIAQTTQHYSKSSAFAIVRRTPGSYQFRVKACTRVYQNNRPLGAPNDSCTSWSSEIVITITTQALINGRQVTAPILSERGLTTDGPDLITPGEWTAPTRRGHGWSFFWANRLRGATESGLVIDPAFDLVGVWYTYGQVIPGNDEWVPVWLFMSMQQQEVNGVPVAIYYGNMLHGSYLVNDECPVGERFIPVEREHDVESCRVSIGTFTLDFSNPGSPKASWIFEQGTGFCNDDDIPCSVNNVDLISGENAIDLGGSNNPSTPNPDLEHYSGFWWEWDNPPEDPGNADLDQRYGLSRFIEGNVETNVLIYYDDAGYRIWSRFDDLDTSTPPSAANKNFCGRYRIGGYPAGMEYVEGTGMLSETVQLSCSPSNGTFRRSLQTNFAAGILRTGDLDIDFQLPAEANRLAGLDTGNVQLRKATSFNDVKLFVNGSALEDEDYICYTGSADVNVCPEGFDFTLTAFTDFDYDTRVYRINADTGASRFEVSLGGDSALVDHVVDPIPTGRHYYALYRDIDVANQSDTLLAKSRVIEVIAAADPDTPVTIPDATLEVGTTLHSRSAHDPSVGKLAGEAGVSGGAATYTIPINVPPGRNGMQPSISIAYNSRAGNGLLGMGWSLAAGSSISRCPATVAQDGKTLGITFTENDRLCLDGQRLIRVNGGGYWNAGGEFRTEIESFKRIKMLTGSGPTSSSMSFEVENKDGTRDTYGTTNASRGAVFRDSGSPSSQTVINTCINKAS